MIIIKQWLDSIYLLNCTGTALFRVVPSYRPWGQLVHRKRIKLGIYQRVFLPTAHVEQLKSKCIFIFFMRILCFEPKFLRQLLHNPSYIVSVFIRECFRESGCSWCKRDVNGKLVNGFCDLKEICPSQQCLKQGINLLYCIMPKEHNYWRLFREMPYLW